jgi:hypothetical protein
MAYRWELGPLSLAEREFIGSHRRRFAATGDSEYSAEFSSSGEVLIVDGYVFDTVTQAGPVFQGVQMPRSVTTLWGIARSLLVLLKSFLRTRSVMIQWEDMAKKHDPKQSTSQMRTSSTYSGRPFPPVKLPTPLRSDSRRRFGTR